MPEPGEPRRKRVKKEIEAEDEKDDGPEAEPVEPSAQQASSIEEKQQQLAAFLSALAQQSPLNTSKPSQAGPSK